MTDTRTHPRTHGSTSARAGALVAGGALLLMAVLAMAANLLVVVPLGSGGAVPGGSAVRMAAAAFLLVALLDVAVAWGLWLVLRRDVPDVVALATWLRVAYAGVLVVAATALLTPFAGGVAPSDEALRAGADRFTDLWQAGLVVFGVHLLLVGAVGLRLRVLPRLVAALLVVAGVGYVVDGLLHVALGGAGALVEQVLLVVLVVSSAGGEIALAVWLLWRGGPPRVDDQRAAPVVGRGSRSVVEV